LPISDFQLPIGLYVREPSQEKTNRQSAIDNRQSHGGEGGIRTHGGRKPTPVFETGALIHYATSPQFKAKGKSKKAKPTNPNRSSLLSFFFYLFTFAFLF
jgi:hypothetical protein